MERKKLWEEISATYSCLLFTEIQPVNCIKKILPQSTYTSRNPSLSAFRISYSPGRTESLLVGKLSSITLAISAISTIPQHPLLGYRFIYCVLAPGNLFRRRHICDFEPAANFPAVTCTSLQERQYPRACMGFGGKTSQGGNHTRAGSYSKLTKFNIMMLTSSRVN